MEEGFDVQKKFFKELKTKLPFNLSVANIVADDLRISLDSAYRRIRCESDLSLREFDILSSKYKISADTVLSKSYNSVNFNYRSINHDIYDFRSYFNSITEEIKSLAQFGLKEIIYAALDLPMFYYFVYPKLASFKIFFWMRNVFEFPDVEEEQYNYSLISEEDLENAHKMWLSYLSVPTTEIWSEETLNTTLRQISFYNEIGMFETKQDIIDILDDLKKVVGHIQKQAECGHKYCPEYNNSLIGNKDNFKMYHNEITLSENLILLKLEKFNMVHMGHNVLNVLSTKDENFYQDAYGFIQKVMRNSALISVTSEKERKRFFNILYHKIDTLIANL